MDLTASFNNQNENSDDNHLINDSNIETNNEIVAEQVRENVSVNDAEFQEFNINQNVVDNNPPIDDIENNIDIRQVENENDQYEIDDSDNDDDENAEDLNDNYGDEDDDNEDDNNEDDDNDDDDNDDDDEEDMNELHDDQYNSSVKPEIINYDLELPTSHGYLGNFQEVITPKSFYDYNEEIIIPLINLPGNHWNDNSVQLLPGQTMPIHFYAPLQISVIRKTMENADHLIGILLRADDLKLISDCSGDKKSKSLIKNNEIFGVLAEIISISEENDTNSPTLPIYGGNGIIIKVKGRERFILKEFRKEITGCVIANVRILPEHVFSINPLLFNSSKINSIKCSNFLSGQMPINSAQNEICNSYSHPAWIFRMHDCTFITNLILRELDEVFKIKVDLKNVKEKEDFKDPKYFSSWLLTNFPFDNNMRIECLKIDCLNQRLLHMSKLIRSFTNISCAKCNLVLCSKSDVFCISKQGFMTAYLNPGGIIHETLTVYKLKNFFLSKAPPSEEFSWFPGYGWQICTCFKCRVHIGWKYTSVKSSLKPDKFWGLTRNAIRYTYDTPKNEDEDNYIKEIQGDLQALH